MSSEINPTLAARLGRRIREVRTERRLTVAALAERSKLSRRMLTLIELGQANPSIASVDRIADGLGTSFAVLVGVGGGLRPEGVEVWSTAPGGRGLLLSAIQTPEYVIELWNCRLTPGEKRTVDSGAAGSEAIHHITSGELSITADGREHRAAAGESVTIPLGLERTYHVISGQDAVYFEVFPQPRSRQD